MKKYLKYLLPLAVIIVGILIAQTLYSLGGNKLSNRIPKEKASEKVISFLNDVALNGEVTASLMDVIEESGVYKVSVSIEDQQYDLYTSKDGKFLFSQPTDMDKAREEKEEPSSSSNQSGDPENITKTDRPEIDLYVMSFCPYGNQAEEAMIPVAELLGDQADIELHYVIYSNYRGGGPNYCLDEESKYCSMHGIQELNQGIRELCVQKYQPEKLWSFVDVVNQNCSYTNADNCWETLAQEVGINTQTIKNCQANEAVKLLAEEVDLNKEFGIKGSPQLIINGEEYQIARTPESYKQTICAAFTSPPEECSQSLSNQGGPASGGCE